MVHSSYGGLVTSSKKSLPGLIVRALISLALFFVLACAPNRTQAADAPLVRANYAAFSGAFAPLWIAADRNLFAKYGFNVGIRYIPPSPTTQGLIGKKL